MSWIKIKNDWARRFVRGAILTALIYIINMFVPSWVFAGDIGRALYYAGIFIISGFAMWHIVDKVQGGA